MLRQRLQKQNYFTPYLSFAALQMADFSCRSCVEEAHDNAFGHGEKYPPQHAR
jgi:hypothetical protein